MSGFNLKNQNLLAMLMAQPQPQQQEPMLPSPMMGQGADVISQDLLMPTNKGPMMPPPQPQAPAANRTQGPMVDFSQKSSGFNTSYDKQLEDAFYKQMQERSAGVGNMQNDIDTLKQKPLGFEDVNLRPALAFADSLMGTNTANVYQAPKGADGRKEMLSKLQEAMMKEKGSISDDQLNYLKTKAQEESFKLRERSMMNAMGARGEREESGVRKEYLNHPVIKGMKEVDQAASAIDANPGVGGPAQQAMVFQFSKILDPGSVVREGEYAQSAANAGAINQARNLFSRLQSGETLSPEQIVMMKGVVKNLSGSYRNRVNDVNAYYTQLADRKGFDPRNVIVDPYAGGVADKAKTAQAATKSIEEMTDEELRKFVGE